MKHTKKALLLSCISMLLCMSMLVGTTFAWFTDTATTGVNTIVAGNLDIKLSYKNANDNDYAEVSESTKDLFVDANGDPILWEPGAVSVCYFQLENLGSLALQYKLKVSYSDTVTYNGVKLSDALKSVVVALDGDKTLTHEEAVAFAEAETAETKALGYSDATAHTMEAKAAAKYFAIVIYMPTTVGNEYNLPTGAPALEIQLGVSLVAAQLSKENDSFGPDYDLEAKFPEQVQASFKPAAATVLKGENVTATIPVDPGLKANGTDVSENTTLVLSVEPTSTNSNITIAEGAEAESYEISLTTADGDKVVSTKSIEVQMNIGAGRTGIITLYHNDDLIESQYAADTGILSFTTTNFSPFTVVETFAAKIGDTYYATLQDAINAANEGDAVILLSDQVLAEMVTIAAGKNITLDLNGMAITVTKSGDRSLYAFDNKGALTLTDSVGTGSITARGNYNYGTMVMNGGTIVACDTNGGYGVWNYGSFTMNGGTIKVTHVGSYADQYGPTGLGNESGATALISGGTFKGVSARAYIIASQGTLEITPAEGEEVNLTAYRGIAINDGTAVINGGTFEVLDANKVEGSYVAYETYYALYVGGGESVTVNGGSFLAPDQSVWNESSTTVVINGGYFNTSMAGVDETHANKAITICGGTYAVKPAAELLAEGYKAYAEGDGYVVKASQFIDNGDNTYTILSAQGLKEFRDAVNAGNNFAKKTVILACDIDLGNEEWTPIGNGTAFYGTFDGQGHTISNLLIATHQQYGVGFFDTIIGGTVKNVTFDSAHVGTKYSGNVYAIVTGYTYGNPTFENVHVKNSSVWAYGKVGAIIGLSEVNGTIGDTLVTMINCTVTNTEIKGAYNCGGLIGRASSKVSLTDCASDATWVRNDRTSYADIDDTTTVNGETITVKGVYMVYPYQGVTYIYAAWGDLYTDAYYEDAALTQNSNYIIADGLCIN